MQDKVAERCLALSDIYKALFGALGENRIRYVVIFCENDFRIIASIAKRVLWVKDIHVCSRGSYVDTIAWHNPTFFSAIFVHYLFLLIKLPPFSLFLCFTVFLLTILIFPSLSLISLSFSFLFLIRFKEISLRSLYLHIILTLLFLVPEFIFWQHFLFYLSSFYSQGSISFSSFLLTSPLFSLFILYFWKSSSRACTLSIYSRGFISFLFSSLGFY